MFLKTLKQQDPEIHDAIVAETRRQDENLELIAGEEYLLHNSDLSDVGPQGLTVTSQHMLVSNVGTLNFRRTPPLEAEKSPALAIPTPVGFERFRDPMSQDPKTLSPAANGWRIDGLISGLVRQFERLDRKHSRRSESQVRPVTYSDRRK